MKPLFVVATADCRPALEVGVVVHDDEPRDAGGSGDDQIGFGKPRCPVSSRDADAASSWPSAGTRTDSIAMVPRQRLSPIGGAATRRPLCPNSDQAMANTAGSKTSVSRRTLLAAMR